MYVRDICCGNCGEVINAIGQLNSNLIKLKSIKKRMKANHAMIELLKMNRRGLND